MKSTGRKKISEEKLSEAGRENLPLYPIGIVAELAGITDQTLRLYEKHGLIKPARRGKDRYYSENDIKWLKCLRDLIHVKKISIEGIKKLLDYAPCWEINECPKETREKCLAFIEKSKPCWELNRRICEQSSGKLCKDCIVYLSRGKKGNLASRLRAG
ncbi:MAG: MerR family transcriptional regulator [Nitrospiraceae bacterium]|nr:MAG: MerR family transcriptional regulator [Nitrospiraceae bacterium]